jgi:hypothetical protein
MTITESIAKDRVPLDRLARAPLAMVFHIV